MIDHKCLFSRVGSARVKLGGKQSECPSSDRCIVGWGAGTNSIISQDQMVHPIRSRPKFILNLDFDYLTAVATPTT